MATYGAYKGAKFLKDEFGTQTFKKGDKINSVMGNDIDYGRHFYAYDNKKDGLKYDIDRVIDIRPAYAAKAGGQGDRYTIQVNGARTYLYFERSSNPTDTKIGRWFVERKVPLKEFL